MRIDDIIAGRMQSDGSTFRRWKRQKSELRLEHWGITGPRKIPWGRNQLLQQLYRWVGSDDGGKIDYAIMDYAIGSKFAKSNEGTMIWSEPLTDEVTAMALKKENTELNQKD